MDLDISDKSISEKVKKHLEEDHLLESTGGSPSRSGDDWSSIDQILSCWVDARKDQTFLIASFRDQIVKVFDVDHMVSRVRDEMFSELLAFKSGERLVKSCCFLDNKFVIACKNLEIYQLAEKDFDRFSEERIGYFSEPSEIMQMDL